MAEHWIWNSGSVLGMLEKEFVEMDFVWVSKTIFQNKVEAS